MALGLTGKGNQAAGVLAERAVDHFSPAAVLFVGVAGALWDTARLGDVVMATHVYAYHGGTSEDDGLKARPRAWEINHAIVQLGSYLGRAGDWASGTVAGPGSPEVHFAPIAAGEVVQNSRISKEAEWIRDHYNDALAIEMEGAGVAQAGHLSGSPVAIVRGISDSADGTKNTSDDGMWQPRAAANAATFAIRLAEEILLNQRSESTMDENRSPVSHVVNNSALGTVGIQAGGNVIGSTVSITTRSQDESAVDIASELAALRDQLARERTTGNIDDETYEAASQELDIARKALVEETPEGNSAFVLALKRLRGLVADIAGLTAQVAALITAVKGLS